MAEESNPPRFWLAHPQGLPGVPCKTCQQRETPCVYRDFIRHRRKKNEYREAHGDVQTHRVSPIRPGLHVSGARRL
ncbi:hypothetical protein N7520_002089 [Penicillium odoratum]|uniref:uncharacterized protein n=1 Tax=Penicillium odoratum TaxID=1167516 RepID=UPI002548993F|nr:uncharacterized protein N7520_002089 [Penicillium odoratum]KAJ5771560.1 hypothetical protein N7520_002089 [Penicillium odoratum]